MLDFFRCVGRAIMGQGIAPLVRELPLGEYVYNVAQDALKKWREKKQLAEMRVEVQQMAQAAFDEVKQVAAEVAAEVAANDPQAQQDVERYLVQIPHTIRQSLRRPDDLSGTTVPADFAFDADDVAKLLPPRMPRFKPGATPKFLKGWELVEQVGVGGFGEVWKGRHRKLANVVAAFKFGHDLSARDVQFLHEANVINQVMRHGKHRGIVELLDAWDEDERDADEIPWLRYEFVAGGDLTRLIVAWRNLPDAERVSRAVTALRELCDTVGYFHRLDPPIVHRDLKPSNVLLTADGGPLKVADFGIGIVSAKRMLSGEVAASLSRAVVLHSYLRGSHTPLYAPPEQRDPKHKPDPRDDVHALGVIGFQMITGQLGRGAGADFVEELTDFGAPLPLAEVLKKCVAQTPTRRPKDAAELGEMLARLDLGGKSAPVPPPASPPVAAGPAKVENPGPTAPKPANPKPIPDASPFRVPPIDQDTDTNDCTLISWLKADRSVVKAGESVAVVETDKSSVEIPADKDGVLQHAARPGDKLKIGDVIGTIHPPRQRPAPRPNVKMPDLPPGLDDYAGELTLCQLTGHDQFVSEVTPSADNRYVVTATTNGTVRLWNPTNGHLLHTLTGHQGSVTEAQFSPDGRLVATTGEDGTTRLWETATGQLVRTLTGPKVIVSSPEFSPDGRRLVTVGADGVARVWDLTTGKQTSTLTGHKESLFAACFTTDGRKIVTQAWSEPNRVWDAGTGRPLPDVAEDSVEVFGGADGDTHLSCDCEGTTATVTLSHAERDFEWALEEVSKPPRAGVTLVRSGDGVVYPGDVAWVKITLANDGRGDLVCTWAGVHSKDDTLNEWRTVFGRVKAGKRAERCLAAILPADTPPGELRGELVFHEGNNFPIPAKPIVFTVRPLPRPDFATTWDVVNDGTGNSHGNGDRQPKRGEYIDLSVSVTNDTGEDLDWLFLSLAAAKVPDGVKVTAPRHDLGPVKDGESASGRVSFSVTDEVKPGPAAFELRVESQDGRTFAVEKVELSIK